MAKRTRIYRCEGPFHRKGDAEAEAAIIRRIGHKAKVKKRGSVYEVCRTVTRKRRRK